MTTAPGLWPRSWPTLLVGLALALGAAMPARAQTETGGASCTRFAFDQELDVEAVTALAHEAPERLLARIERLGIAVLRVPSAAPGRPANPLLARVRHEIESLKRFYAR